MANRITGSIAWNDVEICIITNNRRETYCGTPKLDLSAYKPDIFHLCRPNQFHFRQAVALGSGQTSATIMIDSEGMKVFRVGQLPSYPDDWELMPALQYPFEVWLAVSSYYTHIHMCDAVHGNVRNGKCQKKHILLLELILACHREKNVESMNVNLTSNEYKFLSNVKTAP